MGFKEFPKLLEFAMNGGYFEVADLKGKYAFIDVDGVLAPLWFGGFDEYDSSDHMKVGTRMPPGTMLNRRPAKIMQDIINAGIFREAVVIGHITYGFEETQEKESWLNIYYPSIKKRIWLDHDIRKGSVIDAHVNALEINKSDAVFIDDTLGELIYALRNHSIPPVHVSTLLNLEV